MTKITVDQESLLLALQLVEGASASRATMPVLTHVLLEYDAANSILYLGATDLEVGAWLSMNVQGDSEDFSIAVPAKDGLSAIIRDMPAAGKLELHFTGSQFKLKVTAGKSTATVSGLDGKLFPFIKFEYDNTIKMSGSEFAAALTSTVNFAATDESRPTLTAIETIVRSDSLATAATDGYRLATRRIPLQLPTLEEPVTWLVPAKSFNKVLSLMRRQDVLIGYTETKLAVELDVPSIEGASLFWATNTLDANFPDYRAIIPQHSTLAVTLSAKELLAALKMPGQFARHNANIVRMHFTAGSDELVLTATSDGLGEGRTVCKLLGPADKDLEINFNFAYLMGSASNWDTDSLTLGFTDPTRPVLITAAGTDWKLNGCDVLMPMHPSR